MPPQDLRYPFGGPPLSASIAGCLSLRMRTDGDRSSIGFPNLAHHAGLYQAGWGIPHLNKDGHSLTLGSRTGQAAAFSL